MRGSFGCDKVLCLHLGPTCGGGAWAHHIVDPRTGLPACTDVASATVLARHAVEANANALAVVVLGTGAAKAYLARRPHLRVAIAREDGELWLHGMVLHQAAEVVGEEVR